MIPFTRQKVLLSCIQHSPHAPRRLYNETKKKTAVEINWLKNCLYTFKVSASSPPFISEIKKLNWRGIPSKVFSLCAPQCDTVIGERGFAVHLQAKKKKKGGGGGGGLSWVGGGGLTLVITIKQIMSGYVGKCLKSGPDRDKIGDSIERGNVFFLLFFFFLFCLLQLRGNLSDGVACTNQMLS